MSIEIRSDGSLSNSREQHLAVKCPHCQVLSHITPVSIPNYEKLLQFKPSHVGLVYRCDSCNSPVFLKYVVKKYHDGHVSLSSHYIEIERAREKFSYTYLPEDIEAFFREALTCYSHSCFTAFAVMCQQSAQAVFADLGKTARLRLFDQFIEARDMADIDDRTFALSKNIVFDVDTKISRISATDATVLMELMKDLLYQAYVRKGKLQQAVMMRQYFVAGDKQSPADKNTPADTVVLPVHDREA